MKGKIAGVLILVIDAFIIYFRKDILIELFNGRNINQLDIAKLLLPLLLLITGIYFVFKSDKTKDNEKTTN